MISEIFSYFAWFLIFVGIIINISTLYGIYKFKDFYQKLHITGMTDAAGLPLCLFGLALLQNDIMIFVKITFIIIALLVLSPVATYAIARASLIENFGDKDQK